MMNRTQTRPKSAMRVPFSDKSSYVNRAEKSCIKKKEIVSIVERNDSNSIERLLLVRSDLSNLISQMNQLVTQASEQKELTKKGNQEIESFTNFLSDMHSSLKPWLPRLEQALNTKDKDQTKTCYTPYHKKENKLGGKTVFSQIKTCATPYHPYSQKPKEKERIETQVKGKTDFSQIKTPYKYPSQKEKLENKIEGKMDFSQISTPYYPYSQKENKLEGKTDFSQISTPYNCPYSKKGKEKIENKFESKTVISTPYVPYSEKEKIEDKVEGKMDFSQIDLLVSPSPLVSWRQSPCTVIDAGKQLFLLTPLHKSTTLIGPKNPNLDLNPNGPKTLIESKLESRLLNTGISKTLIEPNPNSNLNPNAPKTIIESKLEPKLPCTGISKTLIESKYSDLNLNLNGPETLIGSKNPNWNLKPNAPKTPIRFTKTPIGSKFESKFPNISKTLISDNLNLNYPDLLGFNESPKLNYKKKEISCTLDWFLSPPKTCVLLQLTPCEKKKEEFLQTTPCDENNREKVEKLENDLIDFVWDDLYKSTGGKKGEMTLKRELWARFESVSNAEFSKKFDKNKGKGFLDMLEEAEEN